MLGSLSLLSLGKNPPTLFFVSFAPQINTSQLMKNTLKTSLEFTKNILVTGAFKETSRRVELEITSKLPTGPNQVIVEFGMGHGNITKEVLKKISPTSKLFAFEVKEEFCDYVDAQINDGRLVIVNDGAETSTNMSVSLCMVLSPLSHSLFSPKKKAALSLMGLMPLCKMAVILVKYFTQKYTSKNSKAFLRK